MLLSALAVRVAESANAIRTIESVVPIKPAADSRTKSSAVITASASVRSLVILPVTLI